MRDRHTCSAVGVATSCSPCRTPARPSSGLGARGCAAQTPCPSLRVDGRRVARRANDTSSAPPTAAARCAVQMLLLRARRVCSRWRDGAVGRRGMKAHGSTSASRRRAAAVDRAIRCSSLGRSLAIDSSAPARAVKGRGGGLAAALGLEALALAAAARASAAGRWRRRVRPSLGLKGAWHRATNGRSCRPAPARGAAGAQVAETLAAAFRAASSGCLHAAAVCIRLRGLPPLPGRRSKVWARRRRIVGSNDARRL